MRYSRFRIKNYKAIRDTTIDLRKDKLVLLLGVNESGKTSILNAIESFDYANDPVKKGRASAFTRICNKRDIAESVATVECDLALDTADKSKITSSLERLLASKTTINESAIPDIITMKREFNFKSGEYTSDCYRIVSGFEFITDLPESEEDGVCRTIIKGTPLIVYFEDFKDRIPNWISTIKDTAHYSASWADVLISLFEYTNKKVPLEGFMSITKPNVRKTAINKVNSELNKVFTNKWNKKLKGPKQIGHVELDYDSQEKLFRFVVIGKDKETVFDIDERSKGAAWYLTFLLKTEFRKKSLNRIYGQPMYLIDEPGSNLHSSAQTTMTKDFRNLASHSTVIYTTHSQYLIDKSDLSNVYIGQHTGKSIKAERYQDYVQGKKPKTTFYQPIIDALEIQPFSLEIPWQKVLIVEGISDYIAYKLLFEHLLKKKLDFVIMPGTGASTLSTLISLNVGWGAAVMVLLDDDEEGKDSAIRYKDKFPALQDNVKTLSDINAKLKGNELEDLFSTNDKRAILELAEMDKSKSGRVKEQEFKNALYIISNLPNPAYLKLMRGLDEKTRQCFDDVYTSIENVLGVKEAT